MEEEKAKLRRILESLETVVTSRAVRAFERSPETFIEEAGALQLIIDRRAKLEKRT